MKAKDTSTHITRRQTLGAVGALTGAALLEPSTASAAAAFADAGLRVENIPEARMLSPAVARTLARLNLRQAMTSAHCLMRYDDQGFRNETDLIERAPFERHPVHRGTRQGGTYQHHPQLAKFKGRYYLAWSNGSADEEAAGQQILVASSDDGRRWSAPQAAVPRHTKENLVHNSVGLRAGADELFLFCWNEVALHDAKLPGMRRIEAGSKHVALYSSGDGRTWRLRVPRLLDPGKDHAAMFEAPRLTRDKNLLCGGSHSGPVVFRWPGADPTASPTIVRVPAAASASFPYGETTWYTARSGLLVMFWRDEKQSLRLYVNTSADGGKSWSAPILSDIPNSMQRVSAGNLPDGRAFLVNDANPRLLDRRQLTLALSSDGLTFDRILMLVDDPTAQRVPGLLKAHGWQYPCALVDDHRLLVAYSVNKEDIECGILDITKL